MLVRDKLNMLSFIYDDKTYPKKKKKLKNETFKILTLKIVTFQDAATKSRILPYVI